MKKLFLILIGLCLSSISVLGQKDSSGLVLAEPEFGTSTFIGKIQGKIPEGHQAKQIKLNLTHPLLHFTDFYIDIEQDGSFKLELPIFGVASGIIDDEFYNGRIYLLPNKLTTLIVTYNEDGSKKVEVDCPLGLKVKDLENMTPKVATIISTPRKTPSSTDYQMDPEEFVANGIERLQEILQNIQSDTILSEKAKSIIGLELTLFGIDNSLMNYQNSMTVRYINTYYRGQPIPDSIPFEPSMVDISYFKFLKDFDLHNPIYFYSSYYHTFIGKMLKNNILDIPTIRDYTQDVWTSNLTQKLAVLLGNDKGLFHELITAAAYTQQIAELNFLTEKQKEDISSNFEHESITAFLLYENDRVAGLIQQNQNDKKLHIIPTPESTDENLLQAIINNHLGKVLVVDFWATWCAPCLEAMDLTAKLKSTFPESDIAYIYITNPSSPPGIWQEKIKDIGGVHYYLTQPQWNYILNQHDFSGIPTYFFYNKSGKLQRKQTAFAGIEAFEKWIQELLIVD